MDIVCVPLAVFGTLLPIVGRERLARELQAATDQSLGRSGARCLLGTVMAF